MRETKAVTSPQEGPGPSSPALVWPSAWDPRASACGSSVIPILSPKVRYEVINFFAFLFNCIGKLLPTIAKTTLYISLILFAVILIIVPATVGMHADDKFVFATFKNSTGRIYDGTALLVGLINQN